MKCVDSIIFDLDGTLVDSRRDIVNAVNYTLRTLGIGEKLWHTHACSNIWHRKKGRYS